MYLSAERMAVANQAVQETFEQTSIAWQTIPHWDTGDPGQTKVRYDATYPPAGAAPLDPQGEGPFGAGSLDVKTEPVRFYVTLAQACAPTPDALLAAVMPRTVKLARTVDEYVVGGLKQYATLFDGKLEEPVYVQELLNALIDARVKVEDVGYRAPSCLLASKAALKALSHLVSGVPVTESLLSTANINSLHRVRELDEPRRPIIDVHYHHHHYDHDDDHEHEHGHYHHHHDHHHNHDEDIDDNNDENPSATKAVAKKAAAKKAVADQQTPQAPERIMLLLGRMQRIAHGCAAAASPGEEPVDLAVSVPPSLEVVGETREDYIELAVRIRYALRIKDVRGVVAVDYTYPSTPSTP